MDREEIKSLINALRLDGDLTEVIGGWEVVVALTLTLLCSVVIAKIYRHTHRTSSYSQSFVQTLVLVSMVTTLIMIVIGSNIARAFSLVGALSIIRFRNAVKETRDVGYIFCSMALAMAAGTRFYGVAILGTGFISCVMLAFHYLDFGASGSPREHVLRVYLPPGQEVDDVLGETLRRLFDSYSQVSLESVKAGLSNRAVLTVRPRPETQPAQVLEEVSKATGGLKVSYSQGQHTEDA